MFRSALVVALMFLLALVGTALAGIALAGTPPTEVASGKAPTIDGTLGEDEWKDAVPLELDPVGEAYLLQDDDALYVGLKVGDNCIPSLALMHQEKVHVLHASASLGTAVYERADGHWKPTRRFTWRCRNGLQSGDECAKFLADEGWYATTTQDGRRGQAEYRIERSLLSGETVRLAIVVCRLQPQPMRACVWPEDVRDGTRNQNLLFGKAETLDFEPHTWARLALGPVLTPAQRFLGTLERLETLAPTHPVDAWVELVELVEAYPDLAVRSERATALRKTLAKDKAVTREIAAQKKLDAALKSTRQRLLDIEKRYAGTRAADLARERLDALEG